MSLPVIAEVCVQKLPFDTRNVFIADGSPPEHIRAPRNCGGKGSVVWKLTFVITTT